MAARLAPHDGETPRPLQENGGIGARANPIAFLYKHVGDNLDPLPIEVTSDLDTATELRDLGRDHSHSELSGFQLWTTGCEEGERAAKQAMSLI